MTSGRDLVMRPPRTAIGLLILRATAALVCTPEIQSGRSMGLSAARSGHRPKAPIPYSFPLSSTTMSSSPGRDATTNTASEKRATTTTESKEDKIHHNDPENITQDGLHALDGSHVQPLLRKHMEELTARNRRTLKTRQHVNPLAASFQKPVDLPEGWFQSAFENPHAPLLVDIAYKKSLALIVSEDQKAFRDLWRMTIGCAKGTFLMSMAKVHPGRNFLGLEIRRPIAAVALARAAELGTRNFHLVCCNVNVDLDAVLTEATRNGASIDTTCIQFPPELITCIERHLRPRGTLFMQSDVFEVMEDMRIITRDTAELLEDTRPDMDDWMEGPEQNPFGIQTEREKVTYSKESPSENRVYRSLFVKKIVV